MEQTVLAPISVGELIDKITILEIKKTKTLDVNKLKNILIELGQLNRLLDQLAIPAVVDTLKIVSLALTTTFLIAKAIHIHPDSSVTLCPHRAKMKCFIRVRNSH